MVNKIQMKNINKKMYSVLFLVFVIIFSMGVNAYNSGLDPSILGHSYDELENLPWNIFEGGIWSLGDYQIGIGGEAKEKLSIYGSEGSEPINFYMGGTQIIASAAYYEEGVWKYASETNPAYRIVFDSLGMSLEGALGGGGIGETISSWNSGLSISPSGDVTFLDTLFLGENGDTLNSWAGVVETDPQINQLNLNEWCSSDGSAINCNNQIAPSQEYADWASLFLLEDVINLNIEGHDIEGNNACYINLLGISGNPDAPFDLIPSEDELFVVDARACKSSTGTLDRQQYIYDYDTYVSWFNTGNAYAEFKTDWASDQITAVEITLNPADTWAGGNNFAYAGLPTQCLVITGDPNTCGDSWVTTETCFTGDKYGCNWDPQASYCGDNIIEGDEECDDGNTDLFEDGCSSSCNVDSGWICSGSPSDCVQNVCGDGVIYYEECDDGDTSSGDGCSATCNIETGYTCIDQPSNCFLCFDSDTPIQMANGFYKFIKDVKIGDILFGWNEITQQIEEATVLNVLVHEIEDTSLSRVEFANGFSFEVTPNHDIYTKNKGWVAAGELIPGDVVIYNDNGVESETEVIVVIEDYSQEDVTYNFKTTTSNYFANDILVHNKCLLGDTLINGVKIEDLKVGDYVKGFVEGKIIDVMVTNVYKKSWKGDLQGYTFTLNDGREITSTPNHKYMTEEGYLEAEKLSLGDYLVTESGEFKIVKISKETITEDYVWDIRTESGNYFANGILVTEN